MTTAHPKVRIQYLRDSQAVYTANGPKACGTPLQVPWASI